MARKPSDAKFRDLAPRIMADILAAIPEWGEEDAAACVGNLAQETGGFTKLQELKPTVAGSRGGWGWAQWTGPRRRAFEAWADKQKLGRSSYEANIGFLLVELRGSEKRAVPAVAKATTLDDKTVAFMKTFERPGVPHLPDRLLWARRAMDVYREQGGAAAGATTPITDPHTVTLVQQWLRNLGYTEVGPADGKVGPFTEAAILAFRADNGLPPGRHIDGRVITALGTATKRRDIDPARENATEPQVRDRIPEVKSTWRARILAQLAAIGSAVGVVWKGLLERFDEAKTYLAPVQDAFADVPPWLWLLAGAGVAGAIWYFNRQAEQTAALAFRDGSRR